MGTQKIILFGGIENIPYVCRMETFKDIEGYGGYFEISDKGRIRNKKTGNFISVRPHSSGYMRLKLSHDGRVSTVNFHILLGRAFLKPVEGCDRISFKDGDKMNVSLDNLYYTNISELNEIDVVAKNHLTPIRELEADYYKGKKKRKVLYRCVCGKEVVYAPTLVNTGKKKSCGCKTVKKKPKRTLKQHTFDIDGTNEFLENKDSLFFVTEIIETARTKADHVIKAQCKNCGRTNESKWKGFLANCKKCLCQVGHGLSKHPLYARFQGMKQRCYDKKDKSYSTYGAKGITICDEWLDDFTAFYNWAMDNGFSPELEIDRKDGTKGYSPENCQWLPKHENCRKQTVDGEEVLY